MEAQAALPPLARAATMNGRSAKPPLLERLRRCRAFSAWAARGLYALLRRTVPEPLSLRHSHLNRIPLGDIHPAVLVHL